MGIHDEASATDESLRKVFAPEGWHVPTIDEWETLKNHLIANGYNYDGTITGNKIAKAMASRIGWNNSVETNVPGSNQSYNNSSKFNALPEGYRDSYGAFNDEGFNAGYWSTTENNDLVFIRYSTLSYSFNALYNDYSSYKTTGCSIRFVRD